MGCNCKGCFSDHIVGMPTAVTVNVLLQPNSAYKWELTDGFGNQYLQAFLTDENGAGVIDFGQLPEGFANAGQASLLVRVLDGDDQSCGYINMPFLVSFECLELNFKAGTPVKDWVGCEVSLAPDLPALAAPENFQGSIASGHSLLTWEANPANPADTEYLLTQNGAVIHQGPELLFDATGLVNGQNYTFSLVATHPEFSPSSPVTIVVVPGNAHFVYVLQLDTAAPATEAAILAGVQVPIVDGADYSVQFTNPASSLKFLHVYEALIQPVKTKVDFGVGEEAIGPSGTFALPVTVTQFRGYISNYKTAIPNNPTQFKQ